MSYIAALVGSIIMVLGVFLLFLSLPGTWVIFALTLVWKLFINENSFTWQLIGLLGGLAVVGEVCEFMAGYYGAKLYGGSSKGSWGGVIGAIVGAVLGAPLFFGFGAILGSLAGAFTGCFLFEKLHGMETPQAVKAAWGTTLGRFGGFSAKLGIALTMLYLSLPSLWSGI